jgi:putative transposase
MNSSIITQLSFHLVIALREGASMTCPEARRSIENAATISTALQGQYVIAAHCGTDHFHLAFTLDEDRTLSQFIRRIKTAGARSARAYVDPEEGQIWQPGYLVLSSSASDRAALVERLRTQDVLHETMCFREEVRQLLEEGGAAPKKKLPFTYREVDEPRIEHVSPNHMPEGQL